MGILRIVGPNKTCKIQQYYRNVVFANFQIWLMSM